MNNKRSAQIESSSIYEKSLLIKTLLAIYIFKEKKNEFEGNSIAMHVIDEKDSINGYRKSASI